MLDEYLGLGHCGLGLEPERLGAGDHMLARLRRTILVKLSGSMPKVEGEKAAITGWNVHESGKTQHELWFALILTRATAA